MKLKQRWQGLKYWQKGAIISFTILLLGEIYIYYSVFDKFAGYSKERIQSLIFTFFVPNLIGWTAIISIMGYRHDKKVKGK